jgi:glycosyltransferase involved in cell wall biosynthesis
VDDALVSLMRASHLLVVPLSYEGFGIAYLEGDGFLGRGHRGSNGAAGEIITPGQHGFLVEPGDAAGLAGCLGQLLEDRERLLALSLAARRRYLSHPTWEQSGEKARQFLLDMINFR